ncbi:hypothetical protein ES705_48841 [subsurface metagenome]
MDAGLSAPVFVSFNNEFNPAILPRFFIKTTLKFSLVQVTVLASSDLRVNIADCKVWTASKSPPEI